jgi:threonine/homoserine/homoserine lactone efflux protein
MLALAAANFVGVVLFAAVYAAAGAHWLSQTAFIVCLLVLFAFVSALWVRTEARHRDLEPLRRVGRIAVGLMMVVIGVPALVLLPLSKLETMLPPEVGVNRAMAPAMALLLVALVLMILVNIVGSVVIAGRAIAARPVRQPPRI